MRSEASCFFFSVEKEHNVLQGSSYNRVYHSACSDWWTTHRKESRLSAPPPMRPLCCILNVWVTYLVCWQVLCVGLHALTVWLCACVWRRMCVCVCVFAQAQWIVVPGRKPELLRILWSLTITNSWKRPVTETGPVAEDFFWEWGGRCVRKWGCERLKGGTEWGRWLFMSGWHHQTLSSPFSFLSVKCYIRFLSSFFFSSSDKLH